MGGGQFLTGDVPLQPFQRYASLRPSVFSRGSPRLSTKCGGAGGTRIEVGVLIVLWSFEFFVALIF
jgi:hypothetical protein